MSTAEEIKNELKNLIEDKSKLIELATKSEDTIKFGSSYQAWYSRAIKIVEALAPERL